MPTPHTLVVTSAKTGPNVTIAGRTYVNVRNLNFDLVKKVLSVQCDVSADGNIEEFDLATAAAVTFAIVTGTYTVTLA